MTAYLAALESAAQEGDTLAMLALADEAEGTPLAKAYRWMAREGRWPLPQDRPGGRVMLTRRSYWTPELRAEYERSVRYPAANDIPDELFERLPGYGPNGKHFATWHDAVAALAAALADSP